MNNDSGDINKSDTEENFSYRLKNFLNSNTPKAKIATVALCVLAVASIPIIVVGAGVLGNAVQVFKMFNGSKKYSKRQIQSAYEGIKRQKLIEYVADKNGKTIVRITTKGRVRLKAFDIELMEIKKQKKWKIRDF